MRSAGRRARPLRAGCWLALVLAAGCGGPDGGAGGWPAALDVSADAETPFGSVVLVTIDTLRADHLPFYGYPRPTAPFLDGLARQGVVFDRAFATTSHTAPSHASIFTGLTPSRHGLLRNGEVLDAGLPTLAAMCARAGFDTAAFTSVSFLEGAASGFATVQGKWRSATQVTSRAVRWLAEQRRGDRVFLWVHYYDVHEWFTGRDLPPAYVEALDGAGPQDEQALYALIAGLQGLPERPPDGPFEPLDWGNTRSRQGRVYRFAPRTRAEVVEWIDRYDSRIVYVDSEIRRLREAVQAADLPGETLWVITADHGEGLGSHGYYGHDEHVYNEQLRVPLILYATGGALAPRRVERLARHVDLLPTLADLLGARGAGADPGLDGASLRPLIEGAPAAGPVRVAFAERRPVDELRRDLGWVDETLDAVQSGTHKLILHGAGGVEFYDLRADPLELKDLSAPGSPESDALLQLLRSRIGWLAAHGAGTGADTGPAPEWADELRALGYVR